MLRFFTVYGPWGRPDMAMFIFAENILNGLPIPVFNNGDMSRDFTYISDITDGILSAIEKIPREIFLPSNLKDYGGFTRDFSTQMLFGANEVELGKQWANNELITNLNETYKPFWYS